MSQSVVALVSMPFHVCAMPPIGLGALQAELGGHGIEARVYNFNLAFLPYIASDLQSAATIHDDLATLWDCLPGEWLFSPFRSEEEDQRYLQRLASALPGREDVLDLLIRLRPCVSHFIRKCAQVILSGDHDMVGFTSSFMQTQPCVALARLLKQTRPSVKILFGGANAFGEMGRAILEQWLTIDVVAHGEADSLIVPLVRALRGEGSLEAVRGISYRAGNDIVDQSAGDIAPNMNGLPTPTYFDYFRDLAELERQWGQKLGLPFYIPIETARGCWWGAKSHCTFCGLNADRMAFRSKSPEVATREFRTLYERHRVRSFFAVDNIIDHAYFDTVLRDLAQQQPRFFIHYELKANLKRSQLQALHDAGVMKVQPGIESLSTPILRLMRKGITAIQNIQTLKWMTELGMNATWFILYGFPGETIGPYEEMVRLLPRLLHLAPPADLAPVFIERFSPYQTRPEDFGINITGPTAWYRHAFPGVPSERLQRLAYRFDYIEPDRDPAINAFIESRLAEAVHRWITAYTANGCTLGVIHGPSESAVVCGPSHAPERVILVDGGASVVLRRAEAIVPESVLVEALGAQPYAEDGHGCLSSDDFARFLRKLGVSLIDHRKWHPPVVADIIDTLDRSGLILREGGRVLTLAVNWTARAGEGVASNHKSVSQRVRRTPTTVAMNVQREFRETL